MLSAKHQESMNSFSTVNTLEFEDTLGDLNPSKVNVNPFNLLGWVTIAIQNVSCLDVQVCWVPSPDIQQWVWVVHSEPFPVFRIPASTWEPRTVHYRHKVKWGGGNA
jgi:hypothetical protein